MSTTFEDAKIGDKAWCMRTGWGEIRDIRQKERYSIAVHFPNEEYKWYTVDGFYDDDDVTRSLFWDEVTIIAPTKPLPKMKVDTKVIVWDDPNRKSKRHFSHFNDIGEICVFQQGGTSFTSKGATNSWKYWELVE